MEKNSEVEWAEIKTCQWCSTPYVIASSDAMLAREKFCSRDCELKDEAYKE